METKPITEGPEGWHRQMARRRLLQRMVIYEHSFARCNKVEHPQEWLRLQTELGEVYREVMQEYGGLTLL
jgi:hypothetical protein